MSEIITERGDPRDRISNQRGGTVGDNWRDHYDSWKLAPGNTQHGSVELDEDGEPIDQDELDAQAEAAAEQRAEQAREDAMFDREDWGE